MTRRQNEQRERHWQQVIQEQKTSGLSASAFCRERGLSKSSFSHWKRKLNDRQRNGSASRSNATTTAAKFLPIEMPDQPQASRSTARTACEVVLPDGCRILVPSGYDASGLGEILDLLAERSC